MEYQSVEKSTVSEYTKNHGHEIHFEKVKILNKEVNFGERM